MTEQRRGQPPVLALDRVRFAEVERLAAYEIGNTLLIAHLDLQRAFGMRAEEYQVFFLIVIATVQRYARSGDPDPAYQGSKPLPAEMAASISRRRIADVLGIPVETVRRIVKGLLDRGLVVERGRGRISTPGGALAHLGVDQTPLRLAGQMVALGNTLARLGCVRVGQQPRRPGEGG
jgi:hypothetical protein